MLHYLGLAMVLHRSSGSDIPGLLWCASSHLRHFYSEAAHHCDLPHASLSLCITVISIITVVESATPGISYLEGKMIHLALPWVALSVSLNVIVTSMICFRLLRMRALVREVLSPEMSRMYTSIAAILIESAAPLSILGIGFIITGAQDKPFVFAFAFVWSMFCVEFESSFMLTRSEHPKVESN